MPDMSEQFWKWLRNYATKKVRDCYMEEVHHDRRCEQCGTWTSEVDGCAKLKESDCGCFEFMTCKKCGHVSKWDCRGMLPVLVKGYNKWITA